MSEVKSARGKRAQINWTLFLFRVYASFSLSRKFLVTRHIYTKKIKTRKRYVLRTFFLCFATRTLCVRCAFVRRERERERGGGVSLSLEQRAYMFAFRFSSYREK